MRGIVSTLLCGLCLFSFAACSKTEQANNNLATATPSSSASPAVATKTPPANIVTASAAEVQLTANGSADAAVQVNIMSGYHINGNPASKYQIATSIDVEAADGITVGQPQYPPYEMKKFAFSPDPIAVYEGQATIRVPLKANAQATKGSHTLRAKVRVQPCDDQVCYPPRNIETSLPIVVK
ncbi:MAG TPA: protein-disulfide reductase DsbD N-terminal domain-containing protein [Pyrinomonadaceae bacterium]|jgi:DsbC/DsbD-like thiol-disulfide interchange protein